MDENIKTDFDKFDEVWARVLACSDQDMDIESIQEETETPHDSILESFMDGEAYSIALYTAMCARTSGDVRAMFGRLVSAEKGHLRKLQTEFFIATGDSYCPAKPEISIRGMMDAIRQAYIGETEASRSYADAAVRALGSSQREMFTALSADEKAHSEKLRGLLERAMK